MRQAAPIFTGGVVSRSIRGAEGTRLHLHGAYSPTREIMLCRSEPLLIILVIALLGGFSGLGGGPFYGTGYYGRRRTRPHTHCRADLGFAPAGFELPGQCPRLKAWNVLRWFDLAHQARSGFSSNRRSHLLDFTLFRYPRKEDAMKNPLFPSNGWRSGSRCGVDWYGSRPRPFTPR